MKIRLVATVVPAMALSFVIAAAQDSPEHLAQLQKDHEELESYTLTMDVVTRTFAADHELDEVIKSDPSLKPSMKKARGKGDFVTIDQLSAVLSASPKLIAIANAHGLTPRILALATISIIQTEISMGAVEKGKHVTELPLIFQGNAANIKLFQDHRAELGTLNQQYPITLF
jgi:hypothetical protein